MSLFSRFRNRIPPEGSTDKQGMELFFSILFQNLKELFSLNLLFIVFSLPLITLPAALTAMSSVTLKMAREEVFSFREDFIGVFKQSFRKSIALGLPAGLILTASFYLIPFYREALKVSSLFYLPLVLVVLTTLFIFLVGMYAFPMLAAVDLPWQQILRNAGILAVARLPYNAAAFMGAAFLWLLALVALPASFLIILTYLFSLLSFIGSFCAWSGIRKYVLKGG